MTYAAMTYPIERPTMDRRPMAAAPRDGTRIFVERIRFRDQRFRIVPAKWHTNPPGTPVEGFWRPLHTSAQGMKDHQLLGWWTA